MGREAPRLQSPRVATGLAIVCAVGVLLVLMDRRVALEAQLVGDGVKRIQAIQELLEAEPKFVDRIALESLIASDSGKALAREFAVQSDVYASGAQPLGSILMELNGAKLAIPDKRTLRALGDYLRNPGCAVPDISGGNLQNLRSKLAGIQASYIPPNGRLDFESLEFDWQPEGIWRVRLFCRPDAEALLSLKVGVDQGDLQGVLTEECLIIDDKVAQGTIQLSREQLMPGVQARQYINRQSALIEEQAEWSALIPMDVPLEGALAEASKQRYFLTVGRRYTSIANFALPLIAAGVLGFLLAAVVRATMWIETWSDAIDKDAIGSLGLVWLAIVLATLTVAFPLSVTQGWFGVLAIRMPPLGYSSALSPLVVAPLLAFFVTRLEKAILKNGRELA